jgi:hypothetical protein
MLINAHWQWPKIRYQLRSLGPECACELKPRPCLSTAQDYNWKVSGDISKINMFYGMTEGCLKGIKAQYGPDPANAQRLGVETKALLTRSIQLKEGERIVRAEYKAGSK